MNVGKSRIKSFPWLDSENKLLRKIWTSKTVDRFSLFAPRTVSAVKQHAIKLRLITKKRWSSEEKAYLMQKYEKFPKKELIENLGRTWVAIKLEARKLKLNRSHDFQRNSQCEVLLNNSLETMYWLGFILADGHIENNRLVIALSVLDKNHLEKFGSYIKTSVRYDDTKCYARVKDVDRISKFVKLYSISNRKTYNPPNIQEYNLSDNQLLALIVGFIDGDGCILKLNRTKYRYPRKGKLATASSKCKLSYNIGIKCHSSWLNNLNFMNESLKRIFDVPSKSKSIINTRGYSHICISHYDIIINLKRFVLKNNIPHLERKWSKIEEANRLRKKLSQTEINSIINEYKRGVNKHILSKRFFVSHHVIKRVLFQENQHLYNQ